MPKRIHSRTEEHQPREHATVARLRRRFGIKKGTLMAFVEDAGRMIVQPVTREFIRGLRGSLKGEPSALEMLLQDRKRERTL